jgi:hypothetical protein
MNPEAAESELEERGVSSAKVMVVHQRAVVAGSDEELLALARQRAADPSVFEEFPPLFQGGEISSTRWDAYDTSMDASTLKNFAADAATGVAVLRNHSTYTDPIGHSLTGRFIAGGGNGVARTESDFFILPDDETKTYANKLRAGVVRDISVGFHGGIWRCTICKKDMARWGWGSSDTCPHLLGVYYTPRDEAGTVKGEAVKARAIIEDAHLSEYSTVYDGATPGAMLKKARAMAVEGLLSDGERERVQARYKTHLPDKRLVVPVSGAMNNRKANTMTEPTLEEGGVRLTDGRLLTVTDVQGLDAAAREARAVRATLDEAKLPKANEPVEAVRGLVAEMGGLRALEAEVVKSKDGDEAPLQTITRLRTQADDGRAYRADLIESALTEGVRAMGNDFPKEDERADLATASIATIKRRSAQWKKAGDALLPGGRITQDGEERTVVSSTSHLPSGAYAA